MFLFSDHFLVETLLRITFEQFTSATVSLMDQKCENSESDYSW